MTRPVSSRAWQRGMVAMLGVVWITTVAASAAQQSTKKSSPAFVIEAGGKYRFGGAPVERAELPQRIFDAVGDAPSSAQVIDLTVDRSVPWATVMDFLAICRDNGYDRLRLSAVRPGGSGRTTPVVTKIAGAEEGVRPLTSGLPPPNREKGERAVTGATPSAPQADQAPPRNDQPVGYGAPPASFPSSPEALFVTAKSEGGGTSVEVNRRAMTVDDAGVYLRFILENEPDDLKMAFLRATSDLTFGVVLDVFLMIKGAGASEVILVIDEIDGPRGFARIRKGKPDAPAPAAVEEPGGVLGGVPADPASPAVTPVSGGVLAGRAVVKPQPNYPAMASAANIEGPVVVEVLVSEDGSVLTARALSGHPLLRDAAVQAAKGWVFTPTELAGRPVKVLGTLTFNFRKG